MILFDMARGEQRRTVGVCLERRGTVRIRTYQTFDGVTTYYEYDGSGNTVARQEAAGTTYYQYDYENLMTRIDFADDSHDYFAYDAD